MKKTLLLGTLLGALMGLGTGCDDGGSGGSGGTGGAGGSGGTGGGATTSATVDLLNGCDAATAEDHTSDATTTVTVTNLTYTPACITIKAGSSVTFQATFSIHPLVGGTVVDLTKTPDAASPITVTNSGTEATFTFPAAGEFPYYCDEHAQSGMAGVVYVVQ